MNLGSLMRIGILACMWGPSFVLIKIAVAEIPPLTLTLLRVGGAAFVLILLTWLSRSMYWPQQGMMWVHLFIMALLALVIPFALINNSEQYIDSALAGIINGFVPIITALLAHFLITSERLTTVRVMGVSFGFIGFLLLLVPSMMDTDGTADTYSVIGVGLAALSYATGIIYGRLFIRSSPELSIPTLQLVLATVIVLPFALVIEQPWTLDMPSQAAWLAVITLAVWGTACAMVYYFRILVYDGAVALSMVVFLLPLFSVFLGNLFLNEALSWHTYIALGLILLGMLLINGLLNVADYNKKAAEIR